MDEISSGSVAVSLSSAFIASVVDLFLFSEPVLVSFEIEYIVSVVVSLLFARFVKHNKPEISILTAIPY